MAIQSLWWPTSPKLHEAAETTVFSRLKMKYRGCHVNIGTVVGLEDCQIWTISMNEHCSDKIPLILLHGLCAGVGFWALNIEALAASGRPIYAIDHLGFGRSSRPKFSSNPAEAEHQLVTAIEIWRIRMNLNKFVLLGHSMGGFLAMSYTLSFPQRIAHLILADPWGMTGRPKRALPLWINALSTVIAPFNPLWPIRAVGPLGPTVMNIVLSQAIRRLFAVNMDEENHTQWEGLNIGEYAYHSNAQDPTGEAAFHTMSDFIWARRPMNERIPHELDSKVDMTILYGAKTIIWRLRQDQVRALRNDDSYCNVQVVKETGHVLFLDKKNEFNKLVLTACAMADMKLGK